MKFVISKSIRKNLLKETVFWINECYIATVKVAEINRIFGTETTHFLINN
jgi:hypothetical protein